MPKCTWCGREAPLTYGWGDYCSKKCEVEAGRQRAEAAQQRAAAALLAAEEARRKQEELDDAARAQGYSDFAAMDSAKLTDVWRKQEQVEKGLIEKSNGIITKIKELAEQHPGPVTENDIKDLAETFVKVSGNFWGKDFCDRSYNFISVKADDWSCVPGLSKDKAEEIVGKFYFLGRKFTATKSEWVTNELYKEVACAENLIDSISFHSDVIAAYLIEHKEGIEDILEPTLYCADKQDTSTETKYLFINYAVSFRWPRL